MIAPYREMVSVAQRLAEACSVPVAVAEGNLAQGVDVARDAVNRGARVVVSRGGTALLITQAPDVCIPVVTIPFTSEELVRAVHRATRLSKTIGIIRFANTLRPDVHTLSHIFNSKIIDIPIESEEEAPRRIAEAAADGARAFVGGVTGVTYAEELGYPAILIESCSDSLSMALSEAVNVVTKTAGLQRRVQLLRRALDLVTDGIIVADSDSRVLEVSRAAEKAMGIQRHSAVGRTVDHLLKEGAPANRWAVHDSDRLGSILVLSRNGPLAKQGSHAPTASSTFADIVGSSKCIRECIRVASRYAQSDFNVLITGETGTGKELFAQSIHNASPRRAGPFVVVNCAALPESLLESELFGYASGAFTGASKSGKVGLFAQAHGGTIFLDEVSAMPISVQQRFLRVLETRAVRPIGDDRVFDVDVRVIAATNRDIRSLVASGAFLPDLFYRLDVLNLNLPPLRDRRGDIPEIAQRMLTEFGSAAPQSPRGFTEAALAILQAYDWPGNVRELRNVVQRLVVCSESECVSASEVANALGIANHLPRPIEEAGDADPDPATRNLKLSAREAELESILRVLDECGGSRTLAARRLGISRVTLWRKLRAYVSDSTR